MTSSHSTSQSTALSRRSLLTRAALGAGVLASGLSLDTALAAPRASTAVPRPRKRVLRLAHLTDIHVQPEKRAGEGMAACLKHVSELADKPDLILTGGDHVMDSFEATFDRTKTQWDLFTKTLADGMNIPVRSCVGNHDAWGWNKAKSKTTGSENNWGKDWAVDALKIPARYYSFDQAGWHFVALDSVFPDGDGYLGKLDDEQAEWLDADLAKVPKGTPTLVLSHIPILTVTTVVYTKPDKDNNFKLDGSLQHCDYARIKAIFEKHNTVRLCLSGHMHLVDRCDYNGVTYLCNGAVSGNWWKGRHRDCDEGYAAINLFDDGSFEHEYIKYGWKAETK